MSKKKKNRNSIIVPDDPTNSGPPLLIDLFLLFIAPPITTLAGIYFLIKRGRNAMKAQQLREFRHYAAIIGDRSAVSIWEIAKRLGKEPGEVANGLQTMIDEGMIESGAYVDRASMMLYLSDDIIETEFVNPTVNIYVNSQADRAASQTVETQFVEQTAPAKPRKIVEKATQAAEPAPQAEARPKPEPRKAPADSEVFEGTLRELRQLNDDIDNEVVSERIDRIGALTASIFRTVREKPEQAAEVRKFMNYYLPTTLKLLKSYRLMEKQSYQGENIQASRKKIEDVLGTLVHAFEQQQDNLFSSDALDVDTDISVLETMLASDGLTQQSGGGLHL